MLSQVIMLFFVIIVQVQDILILKDVNGEIVRYSVCLVNCGS